MKVLFEELSAGQRVGGIEAATQGLVASLRHRGVTVVRSSHTACSDRSCRPDCVHIHGIWSPALVRRWLLWWTRRVPCVVSPHGMLEPWALAHKRLKKSVAWSTYQKCILNRASALHATSPREADNLRKLGLTAMVQTIPWGIEDPDAHVIYRDAREPDARRTALFVGRIYPVKGLPMLVEAWAKVRPPGWKMKLVGPDQNGHSAEVRSLVQNAYLEDEFEFAGPLESAALQVAYQSADLFILPSHTENFGMVVGEALIHGLPVITTRGAPWESLQTNNCGWWTSISADGIAAALAEATSLDDTTRKLMGNRGREWILREFSWDQAAKRMIDLYTSIACP